MRFFCKDSFLLQGLTKPARTTSRFFQLDSDQQSFATHLFNVRTWNFGQLFHKVFA